ncbi:MAG: hypothetical protein EP343_11090 [Deltaproteobacteria bacterium]|nr:MAG: hypothetical protein EP343_11090 [Deltaproteobacteria bacterium]
MSETGNKTQQLTIPLAEMIHTLRLELQDSMEAAKEAPLQLKLESVELELKVQITQESEAHGGLKFWVLSAGGKEKAQEQNVHTFKLKMQPVLSESPGQDVMVADTSTRPG